jgi:hypothetical protein
LPDFKPRTIKNLLSIMYTGEHKLLFDLTSSKTLFVKRGWN